MERIKNIIIDRIGDVKEVRGRKGDVEGHKRADVVQNLKLKGIQSGGCNVREKEQVRLRKELTLVEEMQLQNPSPLDIHMVLVEIMIRYDPAFRSQLASLGSEVTPSKLLSMFLDKHRHLKLAYLCRTLKQGGRHPPYSYLMWLNQWSKLTFIEATRQRVIGVGLTRPPSSVNHQYHHIEPSPNQSIRSLRPQPPKENAPQSFRITFFSREHIFSFIKNQLSQLYSFYDCLELDTEYVGRLIKPKKVCGQKHVNEMVNYLAKNCNCEIVTGINEYSSDYKERKKEYKAVQNNWMNNQSGIKMAARCQEYVKQLKKTVKEEVREIKDKVKRETSVKRRQTFISSKQSNSQSVELQSRKKLTITKMNSFFDNYSNIKIKNVKPPSNPEQKDPCAFNFIKRKDRKHKKQLLKQLNRTDLVCGSQLYMDLDDKNERKMDKSTKTEPSEPLISQTKRVVILEMSGGLFDDGGLNKTRINWQAKKSSLRITRQGLLPKRFM